MHASYPVVDESSCKAFCEQLYQPGGVSFDHAQYSRFYLILAIGEMSQKQPEQFPYQTELRSRDYYQHSWSWLQECIGNPNIITVQILLLHVRLPSQSS